MKKCICILVLAALIMTCSPTAVLAEDYYYDYFKMVNLFIGEKDAEINGQAVTMDQPAFIRNGRTLVPFRFLGEALGAEIKWDAGKYQATLILAGKEVMVTIGVKTASVDGETTTLDVPAEIKGGRTFIPLRFVSEALGAYVSYYSDAQMVKVRYVNPQNWQDYKPPGEADTVYRYPGNWKAAQEKNGTITFTSPKGSKLYVYGLKLKYADALVRLKEIAAQSGYELDSEEPIYPDSPEIGKCLTFRKNSTDIDNPYIDYIYVYDSETDVVSIEEETMLQSDIDMEWPVMNEILG